MWGGWLRYEPHCFAGTGCLDLDGRAAFPPRLAVGVWRCAFARWAYYDQGSLPPSASRAQSGNPAGCETAAAGHPLPPAELWGAADGCTRATTCQLGIARAVVQII